MARLKCGSCMHHSRRDACCQLTGETRRKGDEACGQWTDGKVGKNRLMRNGGSGWQDTGLNGARACTASRK